MKINYSPARCTNIVYGREIEYAQIIEAFRWASLGATEYILISGQAGIGKTTLVNSALMQISREHSYVISGKFDQFQQDIPYEAFIQSFRQLIRKLLTEHKSELEKWRRTLFKAMGVQAAVLAEVIPELHHLVGVTEKPESLPPAETQLRFERAVRQFVRLFCRADQPLVLFIDDLQWADTASMKLLNSMITDPESQYLLVICAYRADEIDDKPLVPSDVELAGVNVRHIQLLPMDLVELQQITADMVDGDERCLLELTQLLYVKSAGNPLYFKQLLQMVLEKEWLRYSQEHNNWELVRNNIAQLPGYEGHLDYIINKIHSLPTLVKQILTSASCLGGQFGVESLQVVSKLSHNDVLFALKIALHEGFLFSLQQEEMYQFAHDRIQQAASSMLSDLERQHIHFAIGMHLYSQLNDENDQQLYETVHHLQEAIELMDAQNRKILVALHAKAAEKALQSSAFTIALHHARLGIELLTENEQDYDLVFKLHLLQAQTEYLCGHYPQAEGNISKLLENARNWTDRAKVYLIQINHYSNMGKYADAIAIGLKALDESGIRIPAKPSRWQILKEVLHTKSILLRNWERFTTLERTKDPKKEIILELMFSIVAPAFLGDRNVFAVLSSRFIRYVLKHGSSHVAPALYAAYGVLIGVLLGDYKNGYRLGEIAVQQAERAGIRSVQCKTYVVFGGIIAPWVRHAKIGEEYLERAVQLGIESGDYVYTSYAIGAHTNLVYIRGDLREIQNVNRNYLQILEQTKDEFIIKNSLVFIDYASRLMSPNSDVITLSDGRSTETDFVAGLIDEESGDVTLYQYYTYKLQIYYWYGMFWEALNYAERAEPYAHKAIHGVHHAEKYFYEALTITALWSSLSPKQSNNLGKRLRRIVRKLKVWSTHCPANFLHKYTCVQAEVYRIKGQDDQAIQLYEQALDQALVEGFIRTRAVIAEITGRYYLQRGITRIATVYLNEALNDYRATGVEAKVSDLLQRYPELLKMEMVEDNPQYPLETKVQESKNTSSIKRNDIHELDIAAIIKGSYALSEDIGLEEVLEQLIKVIVERLDATKGLLLVQKQGELFVQGGLDKYADSIKRGKPLSEYDVVPHSVIRYVTHTQEALIIGHAQSDPLFSPDPYITKNKCKSIVCMPLMVQGRNIGTLYLENQEVNEAFSHNQIDVLQALTSQITFVLRLFESFGIKEEEKIDEDNFDINLESSTFKEPLTERELEVLQLMSIGLTNKEIAQRLGITPGTVKVHCHNLFSKLNVNRRTQAIAEAKKRRIL